MAKIFCYTATGNSLAVAQRLAQTINAQLKPMRGSTSSLEDDVIGFVFPVYFWGLPRSVERFIQDLQFKNDNAYIFAVATYGGIAYHVPGRVKRLLSHKGITLNYGSSIKSVENYTPYYQVKDTPQLQSKIEHSVAKIEQDISKEVNNHPHSDKLLNTIIHKFYPQPQCDQFFTVSDACTSCAVCSKVCPADNIVMTSSQPVFQHQCDHCLACLHNCPVKAIDWKGKTKEKSQYRNTKISLKELIALNTDPT